MKLVKLPSGRFINMEHVVEAAFFPSHPFQGEDHDEPHMTRDSLDLYLILPMVFGADNETNTTQEKIALFNDDAVALHAWLELNSEDAAGVRSIAQAFKK